MTKDKEAPSKLDYVRYMLATPVDEIVEKIDPNYAFVGETEGERAKSMARFIRIRGIAQRGAQILSSDDQDLIVAIMKNYIIQKPQSE